MWSNSSNFTDSSFIGRQEELDTLKEMLRQPVKRLITLIGVGGCGKTSLVKQALNKHIDNFVDECFYVSLINVTTFDEFIRALTSTLKIQVHENSPPSEQVIASLTYNNVLLVLDNFEHLINDETKTFIIDLLQQTQSVKLLVTSRTAIQLETEWKLEIKGLSLPNTRHFETSDSIALMCLEAERHDILIDLNDEYVRKCLLRICECTHGLPLAIKLAMGWIRTLPIGEIADRLEQGLELLHDPKDPHINIRVTFERTWQLLSEYEKRIYEQLAVFKGGFTLDSALKVVGLTENDIASLRDQCLIELVILETQLKSSYRYDLHPLLRQFAHEKLQAEPELLAHVEQKHTSYFINLLSEYERHLRGPKSQEIVAQLTLNADNVRVAWHSAIEHTNIAQIHTALYSLITYYSSIGAFKFLKNALESVNTLLGHKKHLNNMETLTLALTLSRLSGVMQSTNPQKAKLLISRSIELYQSADTPNNQGLAFAYMIKGTNENVLGNAHQADQDMEKSASLYKQDNQDVFERWLAAGLWADAKYTMGNYEKSFDLLDEALKQAAITDNASVRIYLLPWYSRTLFALKRYKEAKLYFKESIITLQKVPIVLPLSWLFRSIVELFDALGCHEVSAEILYLSQAWDYGFANDRRLSQESLDKLLDKNPHIDRYMLQTRACRWLSGDHFDESKLGLKPKLFNYLLDQLNSFDADAFEKSQKIPDFTGRELEVLQLMCNHMPNKVIAEQLFMAEGTVKSHISEIFYKFGLWDKEDRKRSRAITIAKELGLCS